MITKDKLHLYSTKTLQEYIEEFKHLKYEEKSISVTDVINHLRKRAELYEKENKL